MKNIVLIIIALGAFTACDKTYVYDPGYEEDKLVVNGTVDGNGEIDINVSHSYSPFSSFNLNDTSRFVNDAEVVVYENELPYDTLILVNNKGDFQQSKELVFNLENEYSIKVIASSYDLVEVTPFSIPEEISIVKSDYTSISEQEGRVDISLTEEQEGKYLYMLTISGESDGDEDFNVYAHLLEPEQGGSCYSIGYWGNRVFFIQTDCLFLEDDLLSFIFEKNGYKLSERPLLDKLKLKLSYIDKVYFDVPSVNQSDNSTDYGFSEPVLSFTNVIGGYGVVIPKYELEIEIEL